MYISEAKIKNFRGFRELSVKLKKITILIGENDVGKTNFFAALSLPLSSNQIDFSKKKLNISDINKDAIIDFYKSVIANEDNSILLSKLPKVSVTLKFTDPKNNYEKCILSKWLMEEDGNPCFNLRYEFKPKNDNDVISATKEILRDKTIDDTQWFSFPIELYDYSIVSENNEKQIPFLDLQKTRINNIYAERDDFSSEGMLRSNNILTRLLLTALSDSEKSAINNSYIDFFKAIEGTETFDKLINYDDGFDNIRTFLDELECTPNLPNLKSILSNITLKYGDEFLYQKGLGKRNLIYIFLLFAYYKSNEENFNLCCIEEPEAHLSVNNLRVGVDFISKTIEESNSLLQTLISTHNPSIINKLKLNNVVAFTRETAIDLSSADPKLVDYLRKRPNFDILKILFADKVILVEGPSEELLINTFLLKQSSQLHNIEIIAVGQRGYRTFLDIWLTLNKGNPHKVIGVIRDFDNSNASKIDHDRYDEENENVFVRTTAGYTLENDFASAGNNTKLLSTLFEVEENENIIAKYMIAGKTSRMLQVCDAMTREESPLDIVLPSHIQQIIEALS